MDFCKITHNDKNTIEKYTKSWEIENNDFNFTTLYLWGKHGKIKYAEQDDILFIHYDFPDYPQFFLPPIPRDVQSDYKKAVNTAIEEMRKMGIKPCFRSVSEPFYKLLTDSLEQYEEERTPFNDDYVYLAQSLAELKGKKLHSKRNHINSFIANNDNWEYVKITSNDLRECMDLYDQWSLGKNEPTLDDYDERLTVELAIKYMDDLKLFGGGIRINGILKAFSIGEHTSRDMMTVHIEKADASVNGLFPLINQQFVIHESNGAKYVNREDDMGIEGLRKAKLSYHPCRMIEKYKITLKED